MSAVNYLSIKVAVVGVSLFLAGQCYAQLPSVADETRITTCAKIQNESSPTNAQITNTPTATCTNGHSVTLSWKASPSLSPTYNKGVGYIVYRWNKTTDGWCGKIEQVESTTYVDCKVGRDRHIDMRLPLSSSLKKATQRMLLKQWFRSLNLSDQQSVLDFNAC
jgi:hypothetical protein